MDTHNPGGNEPALADALAERLRAFTPDRLERADVPRDDAMGAYVYAAWGNPRTLVNAHLDTVPPNAGWSSDPYTPHVTTDRVVGLGACDTKGSIAATLAALEEAQPRDVAVLFSGDEEAANTCMRSFLATPLSRGLERAIACEPTSCHAGTRHRGIMKLQAHIDGEGGHSSRADTLPAPVVEMSRLAVELHRWGAQKRTEGPEGMRGMCLNVARLDGGVAFNVVPNAASLTFSLRPPPGCDVAALRDEIDRLVHRVAPEARLEVPIDNGPFATADVGAFRPCLGDAAAAPLDLGFWTEAALFSEAGIDAVVYGPGSIDQAHAADEFVPIDELEQATRVLAKVLHGTG